MPRIFIDGFEDGNLGCWDVVNYGSPTKISVRKNTDPLFAQHEFVYPKIGEYVLYLADSTSAANARKNLPTNTPHLYIKLNFQYTGAITNYGFLRIYTSSGTRLYGTLGIIGSEIYYSPNYADAVYNSYVFIEQKKWYLIELYIFFDILGSVTLKINNIDRTVTDIDTRCNVSRLSDPDYILVGPSTSRVIHTLIDDLVVDTEQFPGDGGIVALWPDKDGLGGGLGTPNQFLVQGTPDDKVLVVNSPGPLSAVDSAAIYTEHTNRAQTYICDTTDNSFLHIKSIQLNYRSVITDLAPSNVLIPYIKTASEIYNYGPTQSIMQDIPLTYTKSWDTNPLDGNNPFTYTTVNNIQIGIKSGT